MVYVEKVKIFKIIIWLFFMKARNHQFCNFSMNFWGSMTFIWLPPTIHKGMTKKSFKSHQHNLSIFLPGHNLSEPKQDYLPPDIMQVLQNGGKLLKF